MLDGTSDDEEQNVKDRTGSNEESDLSEISNDKESEPGRTGDDKHKLVQEEGLWVGRVESTNSSRPAIPQYPAPPIFPLAWML